MKCVFTSNVDVDPSTMAESEKAKIKFRINKVGGKKKPIPFFPVGTEYDHPNAAFFCQCGMASPADEECRIAADMTVDEMASAQRLHKRTAAGILESDYEIFDLGVILGYKPDGSYIEGPNYASYMAAREASKAAETSGNDI